MQSRLAAETRAKLLGIDEGTLARWESELSQPTRTRRTLVEQFLNLIREM